MLEAIIILSIIIVILCVAVGNMMVKIEKYEDVVVDQTSYLQNISNILYDSQKHLRSLDESGVFQADDEVGYSFEQMKLVQKELDRYMLPDNYGEKEKQS